MSGLRGKQKDSYTPEDLDDLLKPMTSISNDETIVRGVQAVKRCGWKGNMDFNEREVGTRMDDFQNILDRIKEYFGYKSDSSVADLLGVSKYSLSNFRSRDTVPFKSLVSLCLKENLSLDWLFTGKGNPAVTGVLNTTDSGVNFCSIPWIEDPSINSNEYPRVMINKKWLESKTGNKCENFKLRKIIDDTMEPTFSIGEVVAISCFPETVSHHLQNGIHALSLEGNLLVRRFHILPNGVLRVSCDNKYYSSFEIQIKDKTGIRILGRVVWNGRPV